MFNDLPDVLTVEELQAALSIGRSTAYRLIQSGQILHLRIGKNIKIPRRYLVDYIETACYNNSVAINPSSQGG